MSAPALERVIRRSSARRRAVREHCDLCSAPVPEQHRHLLDTAKDELLCACQACSILFDRDAASDGRYRLIPQHRQSVRDVDATLLGIPVGLAYFIVQPGGGVIANYPSPAGATQWQVDETAWAALVHACPDLEEMAAEVEALLVDTTFGRDEAWVVPIDDCLQLVGVIRREWRGLSGGDRVRPAIDAFFAELRRVDGQDPGR
jgi:hypothetical protein